MWIDLGKLIRENLPDKNGKTLPAGLTSGSYEIRDLTNTGVGTLFEGKIVYDKTYGHVTYGCGSCCGFKGGLHLWYDPLGIPLLGTSDNGATCLDTCSGQYEDVSDNLFGNWDTANHAIATVDTYGTHTGQSIGSTTSSTGGILQAASLHTVCPNNHFGGSGGDNTTPAITSISPAQGLVGTAESVTITGAGFASGATVNAGTNISVSNTTVVSSTQITATFTPTNSVAAGGNQAFTVSVNSGPPSNSKNFYVQIPTHLARITDPGVSPAGPVTNGIGPLVMGTSINVYYPNGTEYGYSNVCGAYQWYTYDVEDQQSNPITNGPLTITETFSGWPTPDPFPTPTGSSIVLTFPSDSIFGDIYALLNSAPPSCPPANASDSFSQQFSATVGSTQYNTITTVVHITRATNSQGLASFTSTITTP